MINEQLNEPLLQASVLAGPLSRNVYVIYLMYFFWSLSNSIWAGSILSAWILLLAQDEESNHFISRPQFNFTVFATFYHGVKLSSRFMSSYKRKHANAVVGGVEALEGFSELLTALPVGYLADKYGRDIICKLAGIGFIFSTFLTLLAILGSWKERDELIILSASLVLWGIFDGVYNGPCETLFSESVPKQKRSYYLNLLQLCYLAPGVVGPLLAILLFQQYGDNWTLDELRLPFLVGVVLELPGAFLCFLLDDKLALPEEVDELSFTDSDSIESKFGDSHENRQGYKFLGVVELNQKSIPYVLYLSDIFYSLGSGMTVKFFPLFFMKDIRLSPSHVQWAYILATVLSLVSSYTAESLSHSFGRVQTVLVARMLGILCLVSIGVLVRHHWNNSVVIILLFCLRTAANSSVYPLDESILMDNVAKTQRAQWKSLDAVTSFGWCGSAFIGGFLADKHGYSFSFLITAAFQLAGFLTYILLLPLVYDENQIESKIKKESLPKSLSILLAARGESITGIPHLNIGIIEEEIIRDSSIPHSTSRSQ